MNVLEALNFVKRYALFLVLTSFICAVAGFVIAVKLPESFESTQTLFVKRQASSESKQFYTYDGYYSAQAAERFADSVFGALKNREVLRYAILKAGGGNFEEAGLDNEVKAVRVKRLSPQLISFSYRNKNLLAAEKLVNGLSGSVLEITSDLNKGGDAGISISFVSPKPLTTTLTINPFLGSLVGLLLGSFVALLISCSHFFYKNIPG